MVGIGTKDHICDLSGKRILIIGATSGIGEAIWRQVSSLGGFGIGVGRSLDVGSAISEEIQDSGGEAEFIQADISDENQVTNLFAKLSDKPLHGAVNNAAMTQDAEQIENTSLDVFDSLFAINVRGIWNCVGHEIAMMRGSGGSIVNIASIAGIRGFMGLSVYTASKHAVIGITRSAALDGASDNIRVNSISPGATMTPMIEQQVKTRPGGFEAVIADIPLNRPSSPDEQAKGAIWLLSDNSSFVTGANLVADGGTTVN